MITNKNTSITDRFIFKKPCYCANNLTGEITYMGKQSNSNCRKICKGLRPSKDEFK